MSILSFEFLFFTAAVWMVYYLLPRRRRWLALLLGSFLFVSCAGWRSVVHLTVVAWNVWLGGLVLEILKRKEADLRSTEGAGRSVKRYETLQKIVLAMLLTFDLGAMAFLKYEPAAAAWLNDLGQGRWSFPVWELAAPLGLSYFTFQSAGWLVDVYRGKAQAQKNPLKMWLFLGYFPQMTQGPISAWKELGGQLFEEHVLEPEVVSGGFLRMLWGYFKKLVIADRLALTTAVLLGEEGLPGWMAVGGAALYMVRLYADFSGGVDVVRGISQMFGIVLPENFRRPFFSESVAEYWRRWHRTLGAWFRSYLLYPFTTSKAGLALGRAASKVFGKMVGRLVPTVVGTFLVFLLIGVWHTANWNAVIYGAYFGFVMAGAILLTPLWKKMNRTFRTPKGGWMRGVRVARTWILVLIPQYFAFTSGPRQGFSLLLQSFSGWDFSGFAKRMTGIMTVREWVIAGIALLVLLAVDVLGERGVDVCGRIAKARVWVRWQVLLALLLGILVLGVYGPEFDGAAFLYTQF
ncbi:MAG: hypothetical protein Q4F41_00625 [Eubacteriales bacterium]|nr:hypothetical protein [Eubacteriales bacterium]